MWWLLVFHVMDGIIIMVVLAIYPLVCVCVFECMRLTILPNLESKGDHLVKIFFKLCSTSFFSLVNLSVTFK